MLVRSCYETLRLQYAKEIKSASPNERRWQIRRHLEQMITQSAPSNVKSPIQKVNWWQKGLTQDTRELTKKLPRRSRSPDGPLKTLRGSQQIPNACSTISKSTGGRARQDVGAL